MFVYAYANIHINASIILRAFIKRKKTENILRETASPFYDLAKYPSRLTKIR